MGNNQMNTIPLFIDCSEPVHDKIMEIIKFKNFLQDKLMIRSQKFKGSLSNNVEVFFGISHCGRILEITTSNEKPHFSKRYMKYLTKKYLNKHQIRNYIKIVASNKQRNGFKFKYFIENANISNIKNCNMKNHTQDKTALKKLRLID